MHVPACRLTAALTSTPPPSGPVSVCLDCARRAEQHRVADGRHLPALRAHERLRGRRRARRAASTVASSTCAGDRGRSPTVGGAGIAHASVRTQSPPPTAVCPPTSCRASGGSRQRPPTGRRSSSRRARPRRDPPAPLQQPPALARRRAAARATPPERPAAHRRLDVPVRELDDRRSRARPARASVTSGDVCRSSPGRVNSKTAMPHR